MKLLALVYLILCNILKWEGAHSNLSWMWWLSQPFPVELLTITTTMPHMQHHMSWSSCLYLNLSGPNRHMTHVCFRQGGQGSPDVGVPDIGSWMCRPQRVWAPPDSSHVRGSMSISSENYCLKPCQRIHVHLIWELLLEAVLRKVESCCFVKL
jgi:hypothetical protein